MDRHRTGGPARRARLARGVCGLLASAGAIALLAAQVAGAYPAKRSCGEPLPGRAACLALHLEVSSGVTPQVAGHAGTAGERTKPFAGFLTPELLHSAYQLPSETSAGASQTIALVDAFDDPTAESDLAVYDKQFGLPPCTSENGCFEKVDQKGEASPLPEVEGGWASEISIDVQMAHAICQSCHVLLVETDSEELGDLGAGVEAAVKLGATEISNSYGATEEPADSALAGADYNHPGILIAASSGDCGYLNTANSCLGDPTGANFPADSPDVLSVGGTTLTQSAGTWTSTAWSEGGSGCSETFSAGLWQTAVANFSATGCAGSRAIADVSAIGDPNTGVDVYDSTPEEPGAGTGWGVWGGTSVSSPIVAAEFALAGGAAGVSYPAATLYSHAGQAGDLYDVTSGADGKCGTRTICKAAAGFDGPTGVGSPLGLGAFALAAAPQSSSPPTISGAAEEGATLTEQHGAWSAAPTEFTYQWELCGPSGGGCHAITGAEGQTYTIAQGDAGSTIRVLETARNASGSNSASSAALGPIASDVPALAGFTPATAITGSTIVLEGTALGAATSVDVAGLNASFSAISASQLEVIVPNGAFKGKVSVTTPHGTATAKKKFAASFTIRSFKPGAGAAGTTVTISGVGFDSSSKVSFDGTAATVLSESAKKLRVSVPTGAASGPITITNSAAPAGTITSAGTFST